MLNIGHRKDEERVLTHSQGQHNFLVSLTPMYIDIKVLNKI